MPSPAAAGRAIVTAIVAAPSAAVPMRLRLQLGMFSSCLLRQGVDLHGLLSGRRIAKAEDSCWRSTFCCVSSIARRKAGMERIFIGRHDAMTPAGRGRLPGELRKPGEVFRTDGFGILRIVALHGPTRHLDQL